MTSQSWWIHQGAGPRRSNPAAVASEALSPILMEHQLITKLVQWGTSSEISQEKIMMDINHYILLIEKLAHKINLNDKNFNNLHTICKEIVLLFTEQKELVPTFTTQYTEQEDAYIQDLANETPDV